MGNWGVTFLQETLFERERLFRRRGIWEYCLRKMSYVKLYFIHFPRDVSGYRAPRLFQVTVGCFYVNCAWLLSALKSYIPAKICPQKVAAFFKDSLPIARSLLKNPPLLF